MENNFELRLNDKVIATLKSEEPMELQDAFIIMAEQVLTYIEEINEEEPSAQ